MYGLGIVGCGMAGTSFAVAAGYHENWQPVAAVGLTAEEAGEFAGRYGMEPGTLDELVKSPDVDVVAVATPPGVHVDAAVACLEAGKHVIVEKPLAVTLEHCDSMLAAASSGGALLMTGQTYRYFTICRRVREIIEAKEFGGLQMIEASVSMDYFTAKRTGWQLDPQMSGGGVVMNPCIHLTDVIRYFAGSEVRSVRAAMGAAKPGVRIDGHAQIFYSFRDREISAALTLSGYGHRNSHLVKLYFDGAMLECDTFNNHFTIFREKEEYRTEQPVPPPYGDNDLVYGYVSQLEDMADAIERGTPLLSDGENGKANVVVNLAVIESAGTGELVEIG